MAGDDWDDFGVVRSGIAYDKAGLDMVTSIASHQLEKFDNCSAKLLRSFPEWKASPDFDAGEASGAIGAKLYQGVSRDAAVQGDRVNRPWLFRNVHLRADRFASAHDSEFGTESKSLVGRFRPSGVRLDQPFQFRPRHNPPHLFQKPLPARLLRVSLETPLRCQGKLTHLRSTPSFHITRINTHSRTSSELP